MKKNPNLNALRFIAASMVLLQHIELYKASGYSETNLNNPVFGMLGFFGVSIFFVLSSFLITTILLGEKQATGTISLKNFYVKRILRIWPLYYLIIVLGFFVLPHLTLFQMPADQLRFGEVEGNRLFPNFFLYLSGLSSLGRTLYGDLAFISHTWTLATEQIFYLAWPFVIMFFNKNLVKVMLLLIVSYHLTSYFLLTKYAYAIPYNRYIFSFLSGIYVQCMAYGGLFAVLLHNKSNSLKILYHPLTFYTSIFTALLFPLLFKQFNIHYYDLYSVLFGIIILNLASNPKYSSALENKATNYLGSISYGIYMYHPIIIVIGIKLALYFGASILIYLVTIPGTILVSHLSYKYFEGFFLRYKPEKSLVQKKPGDLSHLTV